MNNINDLQEQFENLIKQGQELLEKMKENQNANVSKKVRWKPEDGELYYAIWWNGNIDCYTWNNDRSDNIGFRLGNCFRTKGKAQKEIERRYAEQELLDMCDWEKDKPAYEIKYKTSEKCFKADDFGTYSFFSQYRFASGESCQKAIDTLGTDKLKLIFRID